MHGSYVISLLGLSICWAVWKRDDEEESKRFHINPLTTFCSCFSILRGFVTGVSLFFNPPAAAWSHFSMVFFWCHGELHVLWLLCNASGFVRVVRRSYCLGRRRRRRFCFVKCTNIKKSLLHVQINTMSKIVSAAVLRKRRFFFTFHRIPNKTWENDFCEFRTRDLSRVKLNASLPTAPRTPRSYCFVQKKHEPHKEDFLFSVRIELTTSRV